MTLDQLGVDAWGGDFAQVATGASVLRDPVQGGQQPRPLVGDLDHR